MARKKNNSKRKELTDKLDGCLDSMKSESTISEFIFHAYVSSGPPSVYAIGAYVLFPDSPYPLFSTLAAGVVGSTALSTTASFVHAFFPEQKGEPLSHHAIRYGFHALAEIPVLTGSTAAALLLAPYVSESVDPLTLLFVQLSSYATANAVVSAVYPFSSGKSNRTRHSFTVAGLAALLFATPSLLNDSVHQFISDVVAPQISPTTIEPTPVPSPESVVDYTPKPLFTKWPSGAEEKRVNSCFSDRGETLGGSGTEIHGGIDIRAPWHTKIYSVGDGKVVSVDPYEWGRIVVDHGKDISTEYIHLDQILVEKGQKVAAGEILGLSGCRGRGNRVEFCKYSISHKNAHLHFNVIDGNISPSLRDMNDNSTVLEGDNVNPLCYLDESIGFTVVSRAGCDTQGGAYKYCGDYLSPLQLLLDIQQKFGESIGQESLRLVVELQQSDVDAFTRYQGMLYATIATESKGVINPNPKATKGAKGLLQFTAATASAYGLCDNDACTGRDDRLNPDKAIAAGATYHARLYGHFDEYTAVVPFTFASWNTGNALIEYAIKKTEVQDPTWEQVSLVIDEQVVGKFLKGDAYDTLKERNAKVTEINNHVAKTMGYYDYTAFLIENN